MTVWFLHQYITVLNSYVIIITTETILNPHRRRDKSRYIHVILNRRCLQSLPPSIDAAINLHRQFPPPAIVDVSNNYHHQY